MKEEGRWESDPEGKMRLHFMWEGRVHKFRAEGIGMNG